MAAKKKVAKNPTKEIVDFLESKRTEIQKVTPANRSVDEMLKMAVIAVTENKRVLECSPVSIYRAFMQTCDLGISMNPVLSEAYLIPYGSECRLQLGYRGWIKLCKESGEVQDIRSVVVYENDEFIETQGLKPDLKHIRANGPRGCPTHVYTVADFYNGYQKFTVMPWSDIQKAKQLSKKGGKINPAWTMWEDEMAKKVPIKRLVKTLTLGPKVARASAIEDRGDDGVLLDPEVDDVEDFIDASTVVDASEPEFVQERDTYPPKPESKPKKKAKKKAKEDELKVGELPELPELPYQSLKERLNNAPNV